MQFDTKIAIAIRSDLETWQKLNVAAFLASGIAAAFPDPVRAQSGPTTDCAITPYPGNAVSTSRAQYDAPIGIASSLKS
jgi:hypothetical protein